MDRRSFLRGLIAAPAVVKFASLMPVRGIIMDAELSLYGYSPALTALRALREWEGATEYQAGDVVTSHGIIYRAISVNDLMPP